MLLTLFCFLGLLWVSKVVIAGSRSSFVRCVTKKVKALVLIELSMENKRQVGAFSFDHLFGPKDSSSSSSSNGIFGSIFPPPSKVHSLLWVPLDSFVRVCTILGFLDIRPSITIFNKIVAFGGFHGIFFFFNYS